ncbi:phage tail protein [Microbulbifer sp. OS29]|uniref:Phage tail protein n=1 Tax=Microbulbifer okhotskensis TaxID=2926617 RepID=A0A9X2EP43_9GAMM|nr:phage tail protein [Microbulbifer okhotskensis]MCO1333143.1 phage tail protein [Microbulbifer okhotskensis]
MSETMMALGRYRFSIDSAAYQELKHSQAYRWQAQERLQRRPAMQFLGAGEESIEFSGVIYPHFKGGLKQLDAMRIEASKGQPLLLVDGLGFVWGQWVITQIDEGQSFFQGNGQPLKQSFQLKLVNYGADN